MGRSHDWIRRFLTILQLPVRLGIQVGAGNISVPHTVTAYMQDESCDVSMALTAGQYLILLNTYPSWGVQPDISAMACSRYSIHLNHGLYPSIQ